MTVDEGDTAERPGLTLMPEVAVDLPVWHGPGSDSIGCLQAEDLVDLGVSSQLIDRLRAWQEGWEHDHRKTWRGPREFMPGSPLSVRLARQLQAELPAYRIFLGDRPVEQWTG